MKSLLRTVFIVVFWLQFSGVSLGKEVYLQDGGILECQSFWRHNGRIVVKVNRDVILEFEPGEIDVPKTFPAARKKSRQVKRSRQMSNRSTPHAALTAGRVIAPSRRDSAGQAPTDPVPALPQKPKPAAAKPALHPPASVIVPVTAPRPEAEPELSADPAAVLTTEEYQRLTKVNAELMREAIPKRDPGLLKMAIEQQKSLAQQLKNAPPKPEPPWFKYLLIFLASGLLILASLWVIFEKAGQPGVKSVIPFYNCYVLMELSGKPGWWFVLMFIPVVGAIFYLLAMISLAEKFGRSALFGVGLLFLPMCFFPLLAFAGSTYQRPREELNFTFS